MYSLIILILLGFVTIFETSKFNVHSKEVILERNDTSILKGLLAIGIFVGHISQIVSVNHTLGTIESFIYLICTRSGAVIVTVFFFISGYTLNKSFQQKNKLKYSIKKILGVFIPYFIASAVFLLFTRESLIQLKNVMSISKYPLPHAWFVIPYIIFIGVLFISKSVIKNKFFILLINLVALCLLNIYYFRVFPNDWVLISNQGFIIGLFFSMYEKQIIRLLKKRNLYFSLIIVSIFGVFTGYFIYHNNVFHAYSHILALVINNTSFALIIVLLTYLVSCQNFILSFFSKISFELYIYQAFITFTLKNYIFTSPKSFISEFIIISISTLIWIILSWVMNLINSRILNTVNKKL